MSQSHPFISLAFIHSIHLSIINKPLFLSHVWLIHWYVRLLIEAKNTLYSFASRVAMGVFDEYKLAMAVVGLRFSNAGVTLVTRMALVQGMNPRVYVVYKQAIATLVMSPIAYFSRCYLYIYLNSSLSFSPFIIYYSV